MTRKRFVRRVNAGRFTAEKSRLMNRLRWDADRARRDAEMPERLREIEEIEIENLPRKQGDAIGCLQWTDFRTGKVRKWVVRIGSRRDRFTIEAPGERPTSSHGWTWILTNLRKKLCA